MQPPPPWSEVEASLNRSVLRVLAGLGLAGVVIIVVSEIAAHLFEGSLEVLAITAPLAFLALLIPIVVVGPRCPVCKKAWPPLHVRSVRATRKCGQCGVVFE
jgi:hypothetical protein